MTRNLTGGSHSESSDDRSCFFFAPLRETSFQANREDKT